MKIYLYYVGRPRDAHLNAVAVEYIKRAGRYTACEMREIQLERFDLRARHPAGTKVLLDAAGEIMDSGQFARFIERTQLDARDLVFVIGGAEGWPAGWREQADLLLSLSRMTFAHELARTMLAEQIYRAFAILHRHPYAK